MNISAKTEYACIAILELAMNYDSKEPVQIRRIADAHGIPSRFLVQILLQLKGAGLVSSTRGACGGYQLRKSPEHISLADVMGVIEGTRDEVTSNASHQTPVSQTLLSVWNRVADAKQRELAAISLADLAQRVAKQSENMYYI